LKPASVGFNGVELFENDLLTFDGTPAEVRRIGRELGLAITAFQPFRDFEAMPEPQRARNTLKGHNSAAVTAQSPSGKPLHNSTRWTQTAWHSL
jgi:sugar phosphate isomerase/epimerase